MSNKIKPFLFVLMGFMVVINLISLLMPSTVSTAESVMVVAERKNINQGIADLNEWKKWHPLLRTDSTVVIHSPNEATWVSNGTQNTLKVVQKDSAVVQLNISRAGQKDILNYFAIQPIQDQPGFQVEWRVVSQLKWYPWEKFAGMMVGKMSSTAYLQALNSFKAYVEEQPQ